MKLNPNVDKRISLQSQELNKDCNKTPLSYMCWCATNYGHPVRKSPSLHGRKSNHNPNFLGTAEAYFVCRIGPNFKISLIYAFTWCPQSVWCAVKKKFIRLWLLILQACNNNTKIHIHNLQVFIPYNNISILFSSTK